MYTETDTPSLENDDPFRQEAADMPTAEVYGASQFAVVINSSREEVGKLLELVGLVVDGISDSNPGISVTRCSGMPGCLEQT
jgi:hypothetical protein